jgi:hypothetical protein
VLKDLHNLGDTCHDAGVANIGLDDKVEMQRAANTISRVRTELRKLYYVVEDAGRFAKGTERCPECYTVVSKE